MEKEKNFMKMDEYLLKENIKMERKMGEEKNFIIVENYYLMEIIKME